MLVSADVRFVLTSSRTAPFVDLFTLTSVTSCNCLGNQIDIDCSLSGIVNLESKHVPERGGQFYQGRIDTFHRLAKIPVSVLKYQSHHYFHRDFRSLSSSRETDFVEIKRSTKAAIFFFLLVFVIILKHLEQFLPKIIMDVWRSLLLKSTLQNKSVISPSGLESPFIM